MTTLTMRRIKDDFIVTGPDIEPAKFKSRRDAKDWCAQHYPLAHLRDRGGLIPAKIPGHATERSFAPKGSSHSQNKSARRVGRGFLKAWAKLEEVA